MLARYGHLEEIPALATHWDVPVRGALRLATTLAEQQERALPVPRPGHAAHGRPIKFTDIDGLRWPGPRAEFSVWAERLGTPALLERAKALATARAAAAR